MSSHDSTQVNPRDMKRLVYHPHPSPQAWTAWYGDAEFEDGSLVFVAFYYGLMKSPGDADDRFIEFSVYDPDGKPEMVRIRYAKEECTASEERCDVVMGKNFYREENGNYRVYFNEKGLGCDLTYAPVIPGYQPDLEALPGVGPTYVWYCATPRAKVTGTVTYGGKTIEVSGEGYMDYSWDIETMDLPGTENIFWGKFCAGDWFIMWQTGTLFVGRGDRIILESNKGIAKPHDFSTKDTPVDRPEHILFTINDPGVVEGEIKFTVANPILFVDYLKRFKPFQKWFVAAYSGAPAYFRHRLEHDVNLTVLGKKFTDKGISYCEHHRIP